MIVEWIKPNVDDGISHYELNARVLLHLNSMIAMIVLTQSQIHSDDTSMNYVVHRIYVSFVLI